MFGLAFFFLSFCSAVMVPFAPDAPDKPFILLCLAIILATNGLVLMSKIRQPKPVNWLTTDVLFTIGFSLIHFGYFAYWLCDFFDGRGELWHMGASHVPHVVCKSLAMFSCAINAFLVGYHVVRTRRYVASINEFRPPNSIAKRWGQLGRLMVRVAFCCYLLFVAIIGPAVVFGSYAGTNNHSFVANIAYQIGQVLLISGATVSMVARQRFVKLRKRKSLFSLPVGKLDAILILGTIAAIGLHGDRSLLLVLMAAGGVGYSEYFRPIKFRFLAIGFVGVIFLLGLIMVYRSGREVNFSIVENVNNSMVNMGTSAVCGFVAVDYADDNLSFGQKQTLQLLGIIPFGRRLTGYPDNPDTNSSMLLTLLIQGKVGEGVAGTGTSAFSDFYFDFGFAGTTFIFLLLGIGAKTIQNKARTSRSIIWQVAFVNLVSFLAICSRYSVTGGLIRYVLYSAIYTFVFCYLTGAPRKYSIAKQRRERMLKLQANRLMQPTRADQTR